MTFMEYDIHTTTILGVRRKNKIAIGGDGQVTMGDMAFKQKAVKVRRFEMDKNVVLGGFAGAAADALTLFEKFEQKLEEYEGDLKRSVVELAKEWRTDKYLKHLDALLALIEPDGPIVAIGSGGGFAQSAATAFLKSKTMNAKEIVDQSLRIAAELCIYTNDTISILEN